MLFALAATLMVVGVVVRLFFNRELDGTVCYEVEAARRLLAGQQAYSDFYFDQTLALAYWRVLTVELAGFLSMSKSGMVASYFALSQASFIVTSALALLSFLLTMFVVALAPERARFACAKAGQYTRLRNFLLPASLCGFALANMAMAFVYGSCEHVFMLLFTPYLFIRLVAFAGGGTPFNLRLLAGLMAGLGLALNPLFLPLPVLLELIELLANLTQSGAPEKKLVCSVESIALIAALAAASAPMFCLGEAAKGELLGWILPLKLVSFHLEQMAVFGLGASPDRRDIIYYCSFALIFSFGLLDRAAVLRPLAVLILWGFTIYLISMTGLSTTLIIMVWGIILSFAVHVALFIDSGLVRNGFRRSCTMILGWTLGRTQLAGVRLGAAATLALALTAGSAIFLVESLQRKDCFSAIYGPYALDPDFVDLKTVIEEHARPGDYVLIFNGRHHPGFPLYAICGVRPVGYFISSEPFGILFNMQDVKMDTRAAGLPFDFANITATRLIKRLKRDMMYTPRLLLVEGGQTYEHLKASEFKTILDDYTMEGEGRYRSRCSGAREYADWNYRYNIYLPK